jgi:hypothetical protein
MLAQWMRNGGALAERAGYGNVQSWLVRAGLPQYLSAASLLAIAALGAWLHRASRRPGVDGWLLLGVTAIVARVWTYHRIYDDLLALVAAIALFRVAISDSPAVRRVAAGAAVATATVAALAPGRWHERPFPWSTLHETMQVAAWSAMFAVLVWEVHAARTPTRARG